MVEVLGTHFNVNSYGDEPLSKVTLLEGSVLVSAGAVSKRIVPGEQAVSGVGAGLKVLEVSAEDVVDWKDGVFVFNDEPLESVMRRISRWYNVEVEYAGADKGYLYGGSVSRFDKVSKVLRRLELAGGVHFKVDGRRIIAMK
jgi:ferric-dicitrate binding protein FerR (iron transport regulator)